MFRINSARDRTQERTAFSKSFGRFSLKISRSHSSSLEVRMRGLLFFSDLRKEEKEIPVDAAPGANKVRFCAPGVQLSKTTEETVRAVRDLELREIALSPVGGPT